MLTRIPHFDCAGLAAGDDLLAIRIELHRHDTIAIRILDLGDLIQALCSKEEARVSRMYQVYQVEPLRTCVPDFDRAVTRAGHDRLAIGREGNGEDVVAVGALLLGLELESSCGAHGKGVRSERMAVRGPFNG